MSSSPNSRLELGSDSTNRNACTRMTTYCRRGPSAKSGVLSSGNGPVLARVFGDDNHHFWLQSCVRPDVEMTKPLQGRVSKAVAYLEERYRKDAGTVVLFSEAMGRLGETDKSKFNKTVRKHKDFRQALDRLGLVEVSVGTGRHLNALQRSFGPVEGSSYGAHA